MSSSPSTTAARGLKLIGVLSLTLALGACDYVASFSKPKQTPEEAKAEGIALGAGCRQAGQSLEDCYQRNPDSLKAGIFAGWKDMHEYMAAKNIQTVAPPPPAAADKPDAEADAAKDAPKDDRAARRERRERERAEKDKDTSKDKDASKSKDSDSDSKSSRKNRDDGSSKK